MDRAGRVSLRTVEVYEHSARRVKRHLLLPHHERLKQRPRVVVHHVVTLVTGRVEPAQLCVCEPRTRRLSLRVPQRVLRRSPVPLPWLNAGEIANLDHLAGVRDIPLEPPVDGVSCHIQS